MTVRSEIVEDDDGSNYRCVYAVKFPEAVYVLHAFQKKSTRGTSAPQHDVNLIKETSRRCQAGA